ncbi:MAG: hypothetical protein WA771_15385, partial [Chthoniobacterales bacterium]
GMFLGQLTNQTPTPAPDPPAKNTFRPRPIHPTSQLDAAISQPPADRKRFTSRVEEFLTELSTMDESTALGRLRALPADRTLPTALEGFFREMLVGRLAEIGTPPEKFPIRNARDREATLANFVTAKAAHDPAAAETFVIEMRAGPEQTTAARTLLASLGDADPQRGLEFLRTHPEFLTEGSWLFSSWAKNEPISAVHAAGSFNAKFQQSFTHSAIHQWTMDDPSRAAEFVESLPSIEREMGRSAYINALVNKDPELALDTLLARPELGNSMFLDWIGSRLADDVERANSVLERVPPGEFSTRLIGGIAKGLLREGPEIALAWAEGLLPGEREEVVRSVFSSLSRTDPAAAIALAATLPSGGEAAKTVAREWANNDFEAAFKAVTTSLSGDELQTALPGLFSPNYSSIGADFTTRMKLLSTLEPTLQRQAFDSAGANWAMVDPEGIIGQLTGLTGDDRVALAEGILRGLSTAPARLVQTVAEALPRDQQIAKARSISRQLSATDPQAAAQFLLSLPPDPDGTDRGLAITDVAVKWVYDDPSAATAFTAGLPDGKAKDAASVALASELRHFDLESATRILDGVATQTSRRQLIRSIAETWRRVDSTRGRAALMGRLHSDEERQLATSVLAGDNR